MIETAKYGPDKNKPPQLTLAGGNNDRLTVVRINMKLLTPTRISSGKSVEKYHEMEQIHNYFLFLTLDWCNSYQNMLITMWGCFSILIYLAVVLLLKVVKLYREDSDNDGVNKIYRAINENDIVGSIGYLQKYPRCINKFSSDGYTPFQIACANGNTQLVKLMLKKGADVLLKSKKQEPPFYLASFHYIKNPHLKNATCIRELYYAGAKINEPNGKGLTPLQMAAAFGHTPLVKWLLAKGASREVSPSPYLLACSQGHQETAKVIWEASKGFSIEYK